MRFIRLRVKICQLLRNTTFRGHNSMIRSRPDPLRAFTGSGCGYARLTATLVQFLLSIQLVHSVPKVRSGACSAKVNITAQLH